MVVVVEVANRPVAQQILDVRRAIVGQLGALAGHRRHQHEQEADDGADHRDEDDQDGDASAEAAAHQPAHDRVQAQREEQRDSEQGQHLGDPDERLHQAVGHQDAQAPDQPDVERRAPVERRSRRAVLAGLRRAQGDCGARLDTPAAASAASVSATASACWARRRLAARRANGSTRSTQPISCRRGWSSPAAPRADRPAPSPGPRRTERPSPGPAVGVSRLAVLGVGVDVRLGAGVVGGVASGASALSARLGPPRRVGVGSASPSAPPSAPRPSVGLREQAGRRSGRRPSLAPAWPAG